ncbi:hypothetical protein [Prosthecobacter sp.]|jgi:hypothetical protein|uniref:hypothetical protein n=1 Tax=Prosthecobacter sp. TaxID=1965333 RepID=UPI0037CB11A6
METPVTPTSETAAPSAAPIISMEAFNKLKGCFDAPRWAKIEAQAVKQSENLPALCTRLAATSAARYPDNELAASYSAANRLLISLGSTLKKQDVERFEAALNPNAVAVVTTEETAAAPAVTTDEAAPVVKKPRGGKADPAPPPVS